MDLDDHLEGDWHCIPNALNYKPIHKLGSVAILLHMSL